MTNDNNSKKIVLERQYNVPLRRDWLKVPKYKRAKKAISAMKLYVQKHMKSTNVKLGAGVNLALWKDGIRSPPHHLKILAKKYDDESVHVKYVGDNVKIATKVKKINGEKTDKKSTKKKVTKKSQSKNVKDSNAKKEEKVEEKPKVESKEKKSEVKSEVKKEPTTSEKPSPSKKE